MADGVCQCGCGGATKPYACNNANRGSIKGQPQRYIIGHARRGQTYHGPVGHNAGPYVNARGQQREHRVIAERVMGRSLPSTVQVHHVDGNGKNNANTNLVICQDMAYHRLLHYRARVVKAGGNPNTDALCHRCLKTFPQGEFYRRKSTGAIIPQCRECCAVVHQERKSA